MWLLTWRDLQWRRRRFIIAVAATSLAFAMSLVMTWLNARLENEPRRILDVLGADAWMVHADSSGPFTTTNVIPAGLAGQVRRTGGVEQAEPVALLYSTVQLGTTRDVNVIGLDPASITRPGLVDGGRLTGPGQAVVDQALGLDVGDRVEVGGRPLRVVGVASGISYFFGRPTLMIPLADAQAFAFGGQPLASAVMVRGRPGAAPTGLRLMTPDEVRTDLARVLAGSTQTIGILNGLLLLMAVGIIASIVYLSALERVRDFAVLKATGAADRVLVANLAVESLVLSVLAAAAGAVVARVGLLPLIPFGADVTASSLVTLAALAVVTGLVASLAGLRQALKVDPALAFRAA